MEVIDFGRAVGWLRGLQLPEAHEAVLGLQAVLMNARLAQVLQALEPERYEEVRREGLGILEVNGNDLTRLQQAAIDAVEQRFPLAWTMWDEPLNFEGGDLPLYPEPQGVVFMESDWDEVYNGDEEHVEQFRLVAFLRALDWVDSYVVWEELVEKFGWQVGIPAWIGRRVEKIDEKRLHEGLRKAGLGVFVTALQMVSKETENYFLDYDPEAWDGFMSFTLENVQRMETEWKFAQLMLAEMAQAEKMAEEDAGVYGRVLEIFENSLVCYDANEQPKTLMEMWGADDGGEDGEDD
jgi:hypothetical protein